MDQTSQLSHLSRNIYSEASKADNVQFILDLIAKVGADMENVNIAGTSNGVALTYQILINTGAFKDSFECRITPAF